MKKRNRINEIKVTLPSYSVNEAAARAVVSAFTAQLNPTFDELSDIKCAVSEAVTNSIVHGYRDMIGPVLIGVKLYDDRSVRIEVKDKGRGIEDVEVAMQPLFTTDPDGERSGMGFTLIENFMDTLNVISAPGKGTRVVMKKKLSALPVSR
ncbi:MAG: anti-sigma F factor [Clostridia bacterium]|nr:anti-sigma F factor [Clostridia bacterium]